MDFQRKKGRKAKERKITIQRTANSVTVSMKNTTAENRFQPVTKSELKRAKVIAA